MKRRKNRDLHKIVMLSVALASGIGALAYAALTTFDQPVSDQYGCFEGIEQRHTVVLFDASEPRLNTMQTRSVRHYLDELYANLSFNERLSFVTTEGDQISSTPKARFHICGAPRNSDDLENIGAQGVSAGYLKKQKKRLF